MPHPVGLQPQQQIERGRGHRAEIIRPVHVRGAVEAGGANVLQRSEELVVMVLRAVEHQVFEQMGEPGLAGHLVLGAHVVPEVGGDDGRLVVFVNDDTQSVVEHELAVGDVQ